MQLTIDEDRPAESGNQEANANAKHGAGRRRYHFAGCSTVTALAYPNSPEQSDPPTSGFCSIDVTIVEKSYSTITTVNSLVASSTSSCTRKVKV